MSTGHVAMKFAVGNQTQAMIQIFLHDFMMIFLLSTSTFILSENLIVRLLYSLASSTTDRINDS